MSKKQKTLKQSVVQELRTTIMMIFQDLQKRSNNLQKPLERHPYDTILTNLKNQQNRQYLSQINSCYQNICANISLHQAHIGQKQIQMVKFKNILIKCDEKSLINWFRIHTKFSEQLSQTVAQKLMIGKQHTETMKQISNLINLKNPKIMTKEIVDQVKRIKKLSEENIALDKLIHIFRCCKDNKLKDARMIIDSNIAKECQTQIIQFLVELQSIHQHINNFHQYLNKQTFKNRYQEIKEWSNCSNHIMQLYDEVKQRTIELYKFVNQIEKSYQSKMKLAMKYSNLTYQSKLQQLLKVFEVETENAKKLYKIKGSYEELMFKIEQYHNKGVSISFVNSKRKKIDLVQFQQQQLKQFQKTLDNQLRLFSDQQANELKKQIKNLNCRIKEQEYQIKELRNDQNDNKTKELLMQIQKLKGIIIGKQKTIQNLKQQLNQFSKQKYRQKQNQQLKSKVQKLSKKLKMMQQCQEQLININEKINKQKQEQIHHREKIILSLQSNTDKYNCDLQQIKQPNRKQKFHDKQEERMNHLKIQDLQKDIHLKDKKITKLSSQILALTEQVKKIDQCQKIEQKYRALRVSFSLKEKQLSLLEKEKCQFHQLLTEKDNRINELQLQITSFQVKYEMMKDANKNYCNLNQQKNYFQKQLQQLKKQFRIKQRAWETKSREWGIQKDKFEQKQKQICDQMKQLKVIVAQVQEKGQKIRQVQRQKQELAVSIKIMEGLMGNLYQEIDKKQLIFNSLKQKCLDSSNKILEYQKKQIQTNNQLVLMKDKINQLKREIENLTLLLNLQKQNLIDVQKSNQIEKQELKAMVSRIENQKEEALGRVLVLEEQYQNYKNQEEIIEKQKQESLSQLQMTKSAVQNFDYYRKIVTNCPQLNLDGFVLCYIDRFFQGEMLQRQTLYKFRLLSHIQNLMKQKVTKTNLCYKHDPRNKASFHDYIDGKRNILVVSKSQNGAFLAGFYSGLYADKITMTEPSLIISLLENEVFELNPPSEKQKTIYRGMVYDKYYLIFGNSEIRIKFGDKMELFSNFGIANSYFNNRGFKVNALFGEGDKRELSCSAVQIYEIVFLKQNSFIKHQFLLDEGMRSSILKQA